MGHERKRKKRLGPVKGVNKKAALLRPNNKGEFCYFCKGKECGKKWLTICNEEKKIVYACPNVKILGWSPWEMLGKPFYLTIAHEERFLAAKRMEKRFKGQKIPKTKTQLIDRDNNKHLYSFNLKTIMLGGKPYDLATAKPVQQTYIYQDGKTFGQFYMAWTKYIVQNLLARKLIRLEEIPMIYQFDFKNPDISIVADTTKGKYHTKIGRIEKPEIIFTGEADNSVAYWAGEVGLMESMKAGLLSIKGHKIDKFAAIHEMSDYLRGKPFLNWLINQGYTRRVNVSETSVKKAT